MSILTDTLFHPETQNINTGPVILACGDKGTQLQERMPSHLHPWRLHHKLSAQYVYSEQTKDCQSKIKHTCIIVLNRHLIQNHRRQMNPARGTRSR